MCVRACVPVCVSTCQLSSNSLTRFPESFIEVLPVAAPLFHSLCCSLARPLALVMITTLWECVGACMVAAVICVAFLRYQQQHAGSTASEHRKNASVEVLVRRTKHDDQLALRSGQPKNVRGAAS